MKMKTLYKVAYNIQKCFLFYNIPEWLRTSSILWHITYPSIKIPLLYTSLCQSTITKASFSIYSHLLLKYTIYSISIPHQISIFYSINCPFLISTLLTLTFLSTPPHFSESSSLLALTVLESLLLQIHILLHYITVGHSLHKPYHKLYLPTITFLLIVSLKIQQLAYLLFKIDHSVSIQPSFLKVLFV